MPCHPACLPSLRTSCAGEALQSPSAADWRPICGSRFCKDGRESTRRRSPRASATRCDVMDGEWLIVAILAHGAAPSGDQMNGSSLAARLPISAAANQMRSLRSLVALAGRAATQGCLKCAATTCMSSSNRVRAQLQRGGDAMTETYPPSMRRKSQARATSGRRQLGFGHGAILPSPSGAWTHSSSPSVLCVLHRPAVQRLAVTTKSTNDSLCNELMPTSHRQARYVAIAGFRCWPCVTAGRSGRVHEATKDAADTALKHSPGSHAPTLRPTRSTVYSYNSRASPRSNRLRPPRLAPLRRCGNHRGVAALSAAALWAFKALSLQLP